MERDRRSYPVDSLVDIYNYNFESEKKNTLRKLGDPSNENIAFKLPIKKIYNVNFSVGEFTMQLNPTFNNLPIKGSIVLVLLMQIQMLLR